MKIKQLLKTTLILYFWFALPGCGKKDSKAVSETPAGPTNVSPADAPNTSPSRSKFSIEVVGLKEPNNYVVRLSRKNTESNYLISRKSGNESTKTIGAFAKNEMIFEDSDVVAGQDYEYVLLLNETEKKETLAVSIPKDLVVQGTVNEVRTSGYERVFLMDGSRILTQGRDFVLEANELISQNGLIETFAAVTKASIGNTGRTPGKIVIKAKTAKGGLTIINRAENGGDGQSGEKGNTGTKGERGADGSSHAEENPLLPHCSLPFTSGLPDCQLTRRNVCDRGVSSGSQGGVGGSGTQGTAGAKGGNTANVQVFVVKTEDFKPSVRNIPGEGGSGGAGGEGGEGGAGGDPGGRDSLGVCGSASQGPQGARGTNGTSGLKGADGSVSLSCLYLEGSENTCQQLN